MLIIACRSSSDCLISASVTWSSLPKDYAGRVESSMAIVLRMSLIILYCFSLSSSV
jgi:hypothetical protein